MTTIFIIFGSILTLGVLAMTGLYFWFSIWAMTIDNSQDNSEKRWKKSLEPVNHAERI